MEIELSFSIHIDGDEAITYTYKLEDGKDQDFCDLVQESRRKLTHKMKAYIEEHCK